MSAFTPIPLKIRQKAKNLRNIGFPTPVLSGSGNEGQTRLVNLSKSTPSDFYFICNKFTIRPAGSFVKSIL